MAKRSERASKYRGVVAGHRGKPWCARLVSDRKHIALGGYDTQEEAARAYDLAAVKYFGPLARVNFPELLEIPGARAIQLTLGYVAYVDEEDYAEVNKHEWHVLRCNGGRKIYARRWTYSATGKPVGILMHRALVEVTANQDVDHIDGNGLNNRRANIRACSKAQNRKNKSKHASKTYTEYVGVYYRPNSTGKVWRASISHGGKLLQLGAYPTDEQAARAYDDAARKYRGEFAKLNFPIS